MSEINSPSRITIASRLNIWGVLVDGRLVKESMTDHTPLLSWVNTEYPDYLKVNIPKKEQPFTISDWLAVYELRHRDDKIVIDDGFTNTTHPVSGTLFKVQKRTSSGGPLVVVYESLDKRPDYLQSIFRGISGDTNDIYQFALVRRSTTQGWAYYPIPLLFADRDERIRTARELDAWVPNERWVRRRKQDVIQVLFNQGVITESTADELHSLV